MQKPPKRSSGKALQEIFECSIIKFIFNWRNSFVEEVEEDKCTLSCCTVAWAGLNARPAESCKSSRKNQKVHSEFASSSSSSGCILCFNKHKFLLSCYINANDYDCYFLWFSSSLTVKDFCSVTDLSMSEPTLNRNPNTTFIQKQFTGKHPELEISMMGGVFSLFFSALFPKQFSRGWNAIENSKFQ